MATSQIAANAYASVARMGGGATAGNETGLSAGESFASMLQQVSGGVVDQVRSADSAMIAAAKGQTDVVDVVTAVAETEVALEAMVAVRDRVISAYEEIMRMPI